MRRVSWLGAMGALASLAGCGGSNTVVGGPDVGVTDLGLPDGGLPDGGPLDAGPPDAGPGDTGPLDGGSADLGAVDAGLVDAMASDGAAGDAPSLDAGVVDAGPRCPGTQVLCNNRCVDLETDPSACGTCGTACEGAERCVMGRCAVVCPTGQSVCAGQCVDTRNNPAHCGACAMQCPSGRACSDGVCVALCTGSQTVCEGSCRDLQTDRAHCGACAMACATGETCAAGRCVLTCTEGLTVCASACRDLQSDRGNCGMCGLSCPSRSNATSACVSAACRAFCNDGFGDCDGDASNGCETNTQNTTAHCGACNNRCQSANGTAACMAGRCAISACPSNLANCDNNVENGCETSTQSNNLHCGACGVACGTGFACVAGRCELVATSCNALHSARPELQSGVYRLDPDGTGPVEPFEAYCDMTREGGGWTFLATVTNNGDGANQGNWLVSTPTPNNWESTSASFGPLDPTQNQDARSVAFHRIRGRELMVTHRDLFLLRTDASCLNDVTLRDRFAGLGWSCAGSQGFTSFPPCTNACVIAGANPRAGDTALLNGIGRTRLFFKAGEADGAQDSNRDRAYLSTEYRDNVDYPTGLGAFCSGSSCSPRTGDADVNDRSDAITPTAGSEFYGLWIR